MNPQCHHRRRRSLAALLVAGAIASMSIGVASPSASAVMSPAPFPITRVAADATNPFVLDLSEDGRFLLLNPDGGADNVVVDTRTGTETELSALASAISRNGQFVYSVDVKTVTRTSVATGQSETFTIDIDGDWFFGPVGSTDATGDLVTIGASNGNLGRSRGFVFDLTTEVLIELPMETSGNSGISHFSADGDVVTFFEFSTAGANYANAVLWDRSTGDTTVVAMPAGHDPFAGNWSYSSDLEWLTSIDNNELYVEAASGGAPVALPVPLDQIERYRLDIEGRVVFTASAPSGAGVDLPQLFVWQVGDPVATRVSVAPDGELADAFDDQFWVADDGSTVTFVSFSSNLVAGQSATPDRRIYQVALTDLAPPPFDPLTPQRFADSRDEMTFDGRFVDTGPRQGGTDWEIDIAGRGDVPADAQAAIVNVTVLNGVGPGFATVHPCGTLPTASSVNYGAGTIEPNEVIAKLSADGTLCVFTLTTADVIVDVVGFVRASSPYRALDPARFADSRDEPTFDGTFRNTGARVGGTTWTIDIAGRGAVPEAATTAVINLTVTGGVGPGFATVYPCGTVPNASSVNYDVGVTVPNEVIAKLSAGGAVCVFVLTDVEVIVDVVGYLEDVDEFTPLTPTRFADSRDESTFDGNFLDTGPRQGGTVWEVEIAGRGDVSNDATFAVLNLTVTGGAGPGFATVHPCGDLPLASSLNYDVGVTRPNEVVAKLSPEGTVCVFVLATTDVIIDVVGFG